MHDFDATKEEIRQRVDLVDLVAEHVALRRTGNSFSGLCPFHREKTPSFHVIPSKMIFHCFGCKAGGDLFKFVQLREGVTFGEAVRMLADRAGVELTNRRPSTAGEPGRADLARANAWALEFYRKQLLDPAGGESARGYLSERGIAEETAERFGLGLARNANSDLQRAAALAGMSDTLLLAAGLVRRNEQGSTYDTFRHRLVFPIRDTTKRVVGFGGRALGDHKAKYLNTSQNDLFDKGRLLYGLDLARPAISSGGRAIVVEGYTDCIACHQAGFDGAVATLGTAMTEAHVDLLRRHGRELVLVFDSDAAGDAAAERALGVALRHGLTVSLAFVPDGKDPCEFLCNNGASAFESLLTSATDALRFSWHRTCARYASTDGDAGRREAVLEFVRLVAGLIEAGTVDAIQQGLIAGQVAKLLEIRTEQVHGLLARASRPRRREAGEPAPGAARSPSGSASSVRQSALTAILEVLLVEPGLHALAEEVFEPAQFQDRVLRRVAEVVDGLARQLGEFRLAEVLNCLGEPIEAQRATELHLRGEQRGNLEATLRGAVERLRQVAAARELSRMGRTEGPAGEADTDNAVDPASRRLEAVQQASRSFSHFAPRSKLAGARGDDP